MKSPGGLFQPKTSEIYAHVKYRKSFPKQGWTASLKKQYPNSLVVSTHLKNISQIGNLPQIGVKTKNIWNHHLAKNPNHSLE